VPTAAESCIRWRNLHCTLLSSPVFSVFPSRPPQTRRRRAVRRRRRRAHLQWRGALHALERASCTRRVNPRETAGRRRVRRAAESGTCDTWVSTAGGARGEGPRPGLFGLDCCSAAIRRTATAGERALQRGRTRTCESGGPGRGWVAICLLWWRSLRPAMDAPLQHWDGGPGQCVLAARDGGLDYREAWFIGGWLLTDVRVL